MCRAWRLDANCHHHRRNYWRSFIHGPERRQRLAQKRAKRALWNTSCSIVGNEFCQELKDLSLVILQRFGALNLDRSVDELTGNEILRVAQVHFRVQQFAAAWNSFRPVAPIYFVRHLQRETGRLNDGQSNGFVEHPVTTGADTASIKISSGS